MPRYVAFLRAINVGGHTVRMADLRAHLASLALTHVETFIASGNVVFESRAAAPALERRIEAHLLTALGYEVATFLRTDREVSALASYRPFPEAAMNSARALCVGFLGATPTPAARRLIAGLKTAVDDFHVAGREVWWMCRNKQSESKFSNAVFERTVRLRATFRVLNTVQRLAKLYPG